MSAVEINGIKYAESNYQNYYWFWTWPIWCIDDHFMSEITNFASGAGHIRSCEVGKWNIFARCPCGVGHETIQQGQERGYIIGECAGRPVDGAKRWLCDSCGRDGSVLIYNWIGRRVANRWEWKPESEVPEDMRPKKKEQTKDKVEDFDARVKAAVEVEIALRETQKEKVRDNGVSSID